MTQIAPASEVVDDVLTQTGQALIDDEFETFVAYFDLPQVIETFEGPQNVETAEDLKVLFLSVRAFHKSNGVNRLVRSCREAVYTDENHIEGIFDALLFNGNALVQSMPSTFVMLNRRENVWKITYNMYGVNDESGFGSALIHAPKPPKEDTSQRYQAQLQAS